MDHTFSHFMYEKCCRSSFFFIHSIPLTGCQHVRHHLYYYIHKNSKHLTREGYHTQSHTKHVLSMLSKGTYHWVNLQSLNVPTDNGDMRRGGLCHTNLYKAA